MMTTDDDVDMEDPVVAEIPVYLNHLQDPPYICGEIHVLLHSLRPKDRPYGDQGQLSSVEFEEDTESLKINYNLNTRSHTYDSAAQYSLRSHSLISRPVPRDISSSSYCMGVLKDGVLTLVPVKSVSNVRPSFEHVDSEAAQRRSAATLVPQNTGDEPSSSDGSKPLTGKALHYQQLLKSLKTVPASSTGCWRRLDCYDFDSVEAADLFHEHILTCPDSTQPWKQLKLRNLDFYPTTSDHQYLLKLASGSWGTTSSHDNITSEDGLHPSSDHATTASFSTVLNRLDFTRQIESIIQRMQIASFGDILAVLPANTRAKYSETDVLNQLESCALLVQGNWIVLSYLSPHKPYLWDTRDAALLLLRAGREVTYQALASFNSSTKEDSEEILRSICNLDIQTNGWKLKLKPDEKFLSEYSELVKRQDAVANSILNRLKVKKEQVKTASGEEGVSGRRHQVLSEQELDVLGKKLSEKMIDSGGSMKLGEIVHFIQSISSGHYITEPVALEVLRRINAIILRDRWAVGSGRPNDLPDAACLRDIVMQMYRTRDALSKPEIIAEFEKIFKKNCQLSDHDIRRVIKEFAINERGLWVFNGDMIAERRPATTSGGNTKIQALVKAEELEEYLLDNKD